MRAVSPEILAALQKNPKNIRNICILAHVDHGKTTLADSLLASNGIISQKMAGQNENYLINVIDSPGHVDFSGEVCTAVRLCDGAVILIDVVEGICPQTKIALQQAWIEHIQPLLVLNKIDRLILEWKLTPLDAYAHLVQILEQINAVVGELFASDVHKKSENKAAEEEDKRQENLQTFDWSSGLDDSDDSKVYFSPEQGNVVFASALDGWGFRVSHFAKIYSTKLGAREKVLKKTLWGDFYYNSKTKQIMKGAQTKAKKPLFVQFILENIWSVYEAVLIQRDKAMIEKITKSLNLTIAPRDANHKDPKIPLKAIFGQWLTLAEAVLAMVCDFVPSPFELSEDKIEGLMCSSAVKFDALPIETQKLKTAMVCEFVPSPFELSEDKIEGLMCSSAVKFDALPIETQKLKTDFMKCSSSENAPVIICVSKMFPVERKMLPENRQRPLTAEEIALRREAARQRHAEKRKENSENESTDISPQDQKEQESEAENETAFVAFAHQKEQESEAENETAFVAFARIYSGSVHKGQQLYVLGPKHDPEKALNSDNPISEEITVHDLNPEQHITLATVKSLYLLMGKELIEITSVPAGNVIGIGGLEDHVLKSATLSSTVACPSFVDLHSSTVPIVRVAVEPTHLREMPDLVKGLRLLNQADPCVQVFVQETGEHVLVSSGEVHLQRCVDDLKERLLSQDEPSTEDSESAEYIYLKTSNKLSCIKMCAKPLPPAVTKCLEDNSVLLKIIDQIYSCRGEEESILTPETIKRISELKNKLNDYFLEAGEEWTFAVEQIWSFGPRRCGPNILLNRIPSYKRPSVWTSSKTDSTESLHFSYDSTFISGFQLATLCGPLCEEPMMGVCFIVEDWTFEKDVYLNTVETAEEDILNVSKDEDALSKHLEVSETVSIASSGPSSASSTPFGPFTGQIMSTVKEACRRAFQARPQRLMSAMYCCNIQGDKHACCCHLEKQGYRLHTLHEDVD
nr:elongation factor-like GTPase 1 [Parasteatoda tepidariorum]